MKNAVPFLLVLVLVVVAAADAKLPDGVKVIAGAPLRPAMEQCNSTSTTFNCCGQLNFHIFFPHLGPVFINKTACALLDVDAKQNANVTIVIDGIVQYQNSEYATDLYEDCSLNSYDIYFCVNWTKIRWNSINNQLSGCANMKAVFYHDSVCEVGLGCFTIRSP